jgi:hypothetical protein
MNKKPTATIAISLDAAPLLIPIVFEKVSIIFSALVG